MRLTRSVLATAGARTEARERDRDALAHAAKDGRVSVQAG